MLRATAMVAFGLCLVGCASSVLPADRVKLAIGEPPRPGCYLTYVEVDVKADPTFGTVVESVDGVRAPVYWPADYTGHRVGSEVEVRDPAGEVVATTGQRYSYWPTADDRTGSEPAYFGTCLFPIDAGTQASAP